MRWYKKLDILKLPGEKKKTRIFFIVDVQVHNKALDGLAECKSYVMLLHKRDCLNEEVIQKYDMGVDGIE